MSSSDLPEAGARLTLDLSEWESNWASAIADAETLQSTIEDMSTTVDIDVEFTGEDALPFDDIPESTETEVSVTEDADTKSLVDGLTFLVMKEKIEWAIEIAGNVWDFFSKIENLVVSPFLDVEDAVAKINAQTGGEGVKNLSQLIRDLQFADLGSVDEITDVLITARQLGAPMEQAATAALTFTHTFTEEDPSTVLTALNSLVETGLVPNLQDAADLMTVFFQEGGNKGSDALAVVTANAQSWADMGLNGTQALSTINSLLDNNVDSASDAQKMIQTLDDALTTAAASADSPQADALRTLGLDNPKDSGQAMGADFLDGFSAAFTNLPSDQQDVISGVLFGKAGKKFTGALEGITTQGGPFADVVGAAEDAAAAMDDSLRGAIDDFVLAINAKISELLSSDSIDLPGKIADLKAGMKEALDVLANGGTFGEAIEVGLNIPGFNDAVTRFEASVGNFVISILEIIAGIQDFLGKDSSATRRQISQAEVAQLPFNLKVANPDEIAGELQTAVDRGLSTDEIAKASTTAFDELVNSGEFEKAQALLDGLNKVSTTGQPMVAPNLGGVALQDAQAALRDGDLARIQEQIDKGNLIATVSIDTVDWQTQLDAAKEQMNITFGPQEGRGVGVNPFDNLDKIGLGGRGSGPQPGSMFGDVTKIANDLVTAAENADTATSTATGNISTSFDNLNVSLTDNTQAVVDNLNQVETKVTELDAITAEKLTNNTVTASFDAVAVSAGVNFPAVMAWFEQTSAAAASMDITISGHVQHLLNILHDLQFLSAQVATGVQAAIALGGQLPGQPIGAGAGGGGSTTYNNVNVTNNVPNGAAASSNGYAIANSLRLGG